MTRSDARNAHCLSRGRRTLAQHGACLLCACLLQACASTQDVPSSRALLHAPELHTVPFYPQVAYQCGPAALATVLVHSGVDTTAEALVDQVWLPGRRGSLQIELAAATRRQGRLPYLLEPELEALAAELRLGHPVLVLQNLGRRWWPVWHYAVVVGIDAAEGTVVLRSGRQRRSLASLRAFTASWDRADRWAMVTLIPGTLPADPDRMRYLTAVAALEEQGETILAARAYAVWLDLHEEDRAARFGLAQVAQAQGDLAQAAAAYERLLAEAPDDPVVLNNLALIRADQGCHTLARRLLDRIDATTLTEEVLGVIAETRREIETGEAAEDCRAPSTQP